MPGRTPLHVKRHYGELSEKETDAVVRILADLIVAYLKKRSGSPDPVPTAAAANTDEATEAQEVQA